VLLELAVGAPARAPLIIEDDAGSPRRPLIDRQDHGPGRYPDIVLAHVADVEAHITGTVWKIEVEVGDQVEEGETVAILESMKMEMPVEAEDPGKVAEIRVEEGQSVSEGDVLVILE
jgi:acetyl-CoA carboxylase biotin carboxyl carrier protein